MHYSCLCDSAKKLMYSKPGSQVVGENVFGRPVSRFFHFEYVENYLQTHVQVISNQFYLK